MINTPGYYQDGVFSHKRTKLGNDLREGNHFNAALKNAFASRGPFLIEATVPSEYEGLKLKALPHMLNALGSVPSPVAKAIKKKIAP